MKNDIKSNQQLIAYMFNNQVKFQNTQGKMNKDLFSNFNRNLITKSLKTNNLTNKTKYKTSKNSPERLFIPKSLSRQKKLIGVSNIIQKPSSKMSMNKLNIQNQKQTNIMKEEVLKKKILQMKAKKCATTMNSTNNSISLNNSINNNYNNLGFLLNNGIYMNKIKAKLNPEYLQSKMKSGMNSQLTSYRDMKKKNNKSNNNDKINNNTKEGKYFNLINKYVSSSTALAKQPQRQQLQKSLKNKFNTINAKRLGDMYNKNANLDAYSWRGKINPMENTNFSLLNKFNNNYGNKAKHVNNFVFSSTGNNIYKSKQVQPPNQNFHFSIKRINKTTYPSKQNSRKQSAEKTVQNNINRSSINNMQNSNFIIQNYNSPAITMNNNKKNEILIKKANYFNNGNISVNNNIFIYNYSNKKNISNEINRTKYRFNGVNSSNNSRDHTKDTNNNLKKKKIIKDLKRANFDKIINQLYKHKDNINNLNSQKNINENEQDNLMPNINSPNDLKKVVKNNNDKVETSINHKIKQNDIIKNHPPINYIKVNKNSIIGNINQNNSETNEIKEENRNKASSTNISYKKGKSTNKEEKEEEPKLINNKIEKKDKSTKIEKKEKEEKTKDNKNNENKKSTIFRDKDLSCSENDNDSLLEFVNNNIDNVPNYTNTEITESNESVVSLMNENGKLTCYKRDMEILSNYIKNYYKKHKKYPSTKLRFYKYGRLLGKGAFGKVNLSLHLLTGRLVAIKSINKLKITSEKQKQKIKLETTIMKILSKSNNIVKIFETYETKKHICIVMEYICAGDLLSYIKKRGKLTEPVAKFIFKQIILALKFIHENNIVHRDIKLDNILIDLDNNIKVCDFGVSKIIEKDDIMTEQCGTPAYIAPEILLNKGYTGFGVDVWSAGVVLYAMLSGTIPFKGSDMKELHNLIISGNYQEIKDISKDASNLIKKIFEVDPKKRITTENILNHPWLIDVDLNFWKTQNLFTNAEYVLLAKSNVDYRNIANKEDMQENFDIRNIDTTVENGNKNVRTKSFILAPFNTSVTDSIFDSDNESNINNNKGTNDFNNSELKILNGAIKFVAKVKDINRNYELNNNQEIDNGVVISPNDSEEKNKKDYNNYEMPMNKSFHKKIFSKPISPHNEPAEKKEKQKIKNEDLINEEALNMLKDLGYKKSFTKECLINNNINYATASYRLIVKYCFS